MKEVFFLDVYISGNKRLKMGLSEVYGIGQKESIKICKELGLNPRIFIKDLRNKVLDNLASYIKFNYIYGFRLKRLKKRNIKSLIKIHSYRGSRHFLGYLVRGQRSRNKKRRRRF
jgi:small subunit ribosomal protein S13